MIDRRRLDWMLNVYYDNLLKKRKMCNRPSPWGRVMADAGVTGGEFKSKMPSPTIRFCNQGEIDVCKRVKLALWRLERVNESWYVAINLRYVRRYDGSTIAGKAAASACGVSEEAYRKRVERASRWLQNTISSA